MRSELDEAADGAWRNEEGEAAVVVDWMASLGLPLGVPLPLPLPLPRGSGGGPVNDDDRTPGRSVFSCSSSESCSNPAATASEPELGGGG